MQKWNLKSNPVPGFSVGAAPLSFQPLLEGRFIQANTYFDSDASVGKKGSHHFSIEADDS
jgi:hypothetical protein